MNVLITGNYNIHRFYYVMCNARPGLSFLGKTF